MLESVASLGRLFMSGVWGLFSIPVPGFSFTFGQMWVGVLLCSLSLLILKSVFGFGFRGGSGDTPRSNSTNRPRISKERRDDEF